MQYGWAKSFVDFIGYIVSMVNEVVAIAISVAAGTFIADSLGELYDKQIDGSLDKEVSAFLEGFKKGIIDSLVGDGGKNIPEGGD